VGGGFRVLPQRAHRHVARCAEAQPPRATLRGEDGCRGGVRRGARRPRHHDGMTAVVGGT